ncbi:MAG TPA: hypothetical protein VHN20_03850, partial [Beijerinckiaceae bacterium]|nr:hypothetical protein [Beijerinckiaceae bacterium]
DTAHSVSRAAFTARVLTGLIARHGVLVGLSDDEIERYCAEAYRRKPCGQVNVLADGPERPNTRR